MYKWLKWDFLLFIITLLGLMFIRPDIALALGGILTIIFFVMTKRTDSLKYLLLSFIMAVIWVTIAGDLYYYDRGIITIGNVNTFAILEWTMGLFGLQHFIRMLITQLKIKKFFTKILTFTIIYWIILIIVEVLAYHVFGFRDMATSQYPGLPICNCIHAPVFMQTVYLFMGPVYYALTFLIENRIMKNSGALS